MMQTIKALRQSLRSIRRDIKGSDREKFARKLLLKIQKNTDLYTGQKVALYLPNDGEISTKHVINFLKKQGIRVYLPILSGKKLRFAQIGNSFKKNRFGINEPVLTHVLNANQLNIIFVPLVGFDKNKNRIGMGGGFYDRTLAFKKHQNNYKNPKLYGLAFDCQQVENLKAQEWDIPLDGIITPTKVYR